MSILAAEPEMYPQYFLAGGPSWCRTPLSLVVSPHQAPPGEDGRPCPAQPADHPLSSPNHPREPDAGRAKIRSTLPLFPGYLFLYGDDYRALRGPAGEPSGEHPRGVEPSSPGAGPAQLYQLLSSGLPFAPEPTNVVGTVILILDGPLKGITGTVVRRGGRDRFVALVRFLGRGATVDLQDWRVELVPDRPAVASNRPAVVQDG